MKECKHDWGQMCYRFGNRWIASSDLVCKKCGAKAWRISVPQKGKK